MGCRSLPTTARRPAPTRTGRWRWSLSAVPEKRRGLGRGLELLVGGEGSSELAHLPVETIHANPRQPRKRFDNEATSALADSIRSQGLVQPVVVRPRAAGGFELIAGELRGREDEAAQGREGRSGAGGACTSRRRARHRLHRARPRGQARDLVPGRDRAGRAGGGAGKTRRLAVSPERVAPFGTRDAP